MQIVLYGVAVSAFVAKVRAALDLKGLPHEEREPPDGYGSAAYRAIVPAGSVPGLVVDGAPLFGSNAILEFLEEAAPEPPLLPADPLGRALTRALAGYSDDRIEAAGRAMFPLVKRGWRADPEAAAQGAARLAEALARLEDICAAAPAGLAPGGRAGMAECALAPAIQMGFMLCEEVERPLTPPPRVARWMAAAGEDPAIARSLAIQRAAMDEWLARWRAPGGSCGRG
ncbi:glutathione S-transferase family protein [Oceanicella actignis]|uniref:Maleylpyruvate isomerase n=1 Tax=Oceanicella actignis TaxID=1189325 RepID=A0A1M7TP07_9RHOB|nr:glutathione S-transferase family protein [Oceanicella actignis]SET73107.1 glutathione S-transferase [Oceanicella actignis]SHN72398.1 maleylpyruvate isomerase [Oceanicella actignis]